MKSITKSGKRGKPFRPGNHFGKGRPSGSRNKITLALEEIMEGEGEAITRTAIRLAKKGAPRALKLCLDRVLPARREARLKLALPKIETAGDIHAAFQIVLEGVADGRVSTDQAAHITNVLEFGRKSIETHQLAQRVDALEKSQNERLAA